MLSKNDLVLLYAGGGSAGSASGVSAVRPFGTSPRGDPLAIASLTTSSLLNFALDVAKSKSESGTSTLACPGRPPRPRPRWTGPPRTALAFTLISFTLLVKLSMTLPLGAGAPDAALRFAMATATAALAASVASRSEAALPAVVALLTVAVTVVSVDAWPALGCAAIGTAGAWRLFLGPVGAVLGASVALALPLPPSDAAVALTSSIEGLESTGGVGATAAICGCASDLDSAAGAGAVGPPDLVPAVFWLLGVARF